MSCLDSLGGVANGAHLIEHKSLLRQRIHLTRGLRSLPCTKPNTQVACSKLSRQLIGMVQECIWALMYQTPTANINNRIVSRVEECTRRFGLGRKWIDVRQLVLSRPEWRRASVIHVIFVLIESLNKRKLVVPNN